jgi:hypothetical protein
LFRTRQESRCTSSETRLGVVGRCFGRGGDQVAREFEPVRGGEGDETDGEEEGGVDCWKGFWLKEDVRVLVGARGEQEGERTMRPIVEGRKRGEGERGRAWKVRRSKSDASGRRDFSVRLSEDD